MTSLKMIQFDRQECKLEYEMKLKMNIQSIVCGKRAASKTVQWFFSVNIQLN